MISSQAHSIGLESFIHDLGKTKIKNEFLILLVKLTYFTRSHYLISTSWKEINCSLQIRKIRKTVRLLLMMNITPYFISVQVYLSLLGGQVRQKEHLSIHILNLFKISTINPEYSHWVNENRDDHNEITESKVKRKMTTWFFLDKTVHFLR